MQRDYAASPERVFEAWTRVELLERWLGCSPGMLWTIHEWDVRVGGALHVSLEFDDGPFEVRGEFLLVEPPRRLRYRWSGESIIDVTIDPRGSGSRVTVEHSGLGTDEEHEATNGGWTNSLGQLDGLLRKG
jgi:uncharacterized protein YndB with AHSA1/START domain